MLCWQEDEGIEEDPDVKGGGRAAEDRRRNIKQVRGHPSRNWTDFGGHTASTVTEQALRYTW